MGTVLAAILAIAVKFKGLLLGLKFAIPAWSFLLSLGAYALFFGWPLAIVILLSLAAHELGHYYAYRTYGLPARLPVFLPFLGAFTAGAIAPELEQDAYIALAGPAVGFVLAGACYAVGLATSERFWLACADISAFLNLFNMIPMLPFDGGRVIGAIWPPLWIAGIVAFLAVAYWIGVPLFLVAIIALLGAPAMWAAFRGRVDPRAAAMTNSARMRVGLWYLAVLIGLTLVLGQAHQGLGNLASSPL